MLILLLGIACAPDDGAVASSTTTMARPACNPFAFQDDCLGPWPSEWGMVEDPATATGWRVHLRNEMFFGQSGALPLDLAMFDRLDGASPLAPVVVDVPFDLDTAFLAGHGQDALTLDPDYPIALVRLSDGSRTRLMVEMDQNNRDGTWEGRHPLLLRPVEPMAFGERYLVVLGPVTAGDGTPLEPTPAFAALRDGTPAEGEDAAWIESLRADYEDALFPAAEAAGFRREDLVAAWAFRVASEEATAGLVRAMRSAALDAIAAEGGVPFTIDYAEQDVDENTALLLSGTFQPPSFLSPDSELVVDEAGAPVLQADRPAYRWALSVPTGLDPATPAPLTVFGHGLFGSGDDYLLGSIGEDAIRPMAAEAGEVVVATDWIGLTNEDLQDIALEVIEDLGRLTMVTDRLAQSLVNNVALVELVRGALQEADEVLALGRQADLVDPEVLHYYGVSLGGIQGTSFVAIEDRVQRAVLAVPGAGWDTMIRRSTNFADFDQLLDAVYEDPLAQAVLLALAQGYFDVVDPGNVGRSLAGRSDLVAVWQEAIGDCQVPNVATDLLVRAVDAVHLDVAIAPIDGRPVGMGPAASGRWITQVEDPALLAAYTPPDQNTIPEVDNGAHGLASTESMLDQVRSVLGEGIAVHPCEGPCDPN